MNSSFVDVDEDDVVAQIKSESREFCTEEITDPDVHTHARVKMILPPS